jgi:hypothetical protein
MCRPVGREAGRQAYLWSHERLGNDPVRMDNKMTKRSE